MLRRLVRWIKSTSSARRCAGTKEEVEPSESPNRLDCRRVHRHRAGHRRCDEIDRRGAVMAERKADLAIVVDQSRNFVAGGRHDGWRGPRRERKRVVVPTEENSLQKDRKNAEYRGGVARRWQLRLAGPIPRGESQTHVGLVPPFSTLPIDHMIHYNTTPRSPFVVRALVLS